MLSITIDGVEYQVHPEAERTLMFARYLVKQIDGKFYTDKETAKLLAAFHFFINPTPFDL